MKYLSFSELQKKLGNRSRSTIYRDVEFGRLPKLIKIGARLYWDEAEIDAAIQNLKLIGQDMPEASVADLGSR